MNKWQCQHPGCDIACRCDIACIGVGGAIGLRAIGWYFEYGPKIFCPVHRPDKHLQMSSARYHDCTGTDDQGNCSMCTATEIANRWQWLMERLERL